MSVPGVAPMILVSLVVKTPGATQHTQNHEGRLKV